MATTAQSRRARRTSELPDAAVSYLRVSTTKQMYTAVDIDPDGNSISTQREFAERKATGYNVPIEKEFIEPGQSAKTLLDRPVFQELLEYLKANAHIKYVIVYMRSRAFRNHFDAAIVGHQLTKLGVRLISAKEDFGEGPHAVAMEGVIDVMNGYQNTVQGLDISSKMHRKAVHGGTLGPARVGYLNVRETFEGKQINSIALDPERAPLIRQGFELYASGEYTLDQLADTMTDRGLTAPARGKQRERPVDGKWWHRILQDSYYAGDLVHLGEVFDGRHDPIVSRELFAQVQEVRRQRSGKGQRERVHHHYLKGILFCDRCAQQERTSRLVFTQASGRGGTYHYYFCVGRQRGECDLPYLRVQDVEEAVVKHYRTIRLSDAFIEDVDAALSKALESETTATRTSHAQIEKRLKELDDKEERLIDLAADGTIPQAKIRDRLRAIQVERERASTSLEDITAELKIGRDILTKALEQLRHPDELYAKANDSVRRYMDGTFFAALYVDLDGVRASTLTDPFADFHRALWARTDDKGGTSQPTAQTPGNAKSPRNPRASVNRLSDEVSLTSFFSDGGSNTATLVPPMGFEPTLPP